MVQLGLSAYRRAQRWRVEETGECLFLIDVDLPDPNTADMQHLFEVADQQHQRVRADKVIHEAVHYWWSDQVGEAPSLLNEGVAAYFERILATRWQERQNELIHSWRRYAGSARPGFLRRLCRNETFWSEDAAGEPVYEVGGQLVSFLLDHHGLPKVRQIFLESHYDDPHLEEHIEEVTGESIDSLEQQIGRSTHLVPPTGFWRTPSDGRRR